MVGIRHLFIASSVILAASLSISSHASDIESGKLDVSTSVVATETPKTNVELFEQWDKSSFAIFFRDKTIDFSNYDEIIIFPLSFEEMVFSKNVDDQLKKSWKETEYKEMVEIFEFFDKSAAKKFKSSKVLKLTDKGGPKVLAMQFRMKEFFPMTEHKQVGLNTVGNSQNRLAVGTFTYEAVLAESQTGKLVAVIRDKTRITPAFITTNYRVNQNRAWQRSFKSIVDKLHDDMKNLKNLSK